MTVGVDGRSTLVLGVVDIEIECSIVRCNCVVGSVYAVVVLAGGGLGVVVESQGERARSRGRGGGGQPWGDLVGQGNMIVAEGGHASRGVQRESGGDEGKRTEERGAHR